MRKYVYRADFENKKRDLRNDSTINAGLVAGPALAVLGVVMNASARKNLEKALSNKVEAQVMAEQLKAVAISCNGIAKRADMFNALLGKLDSVFVTLISQFEYKEVELERMIEAAKKAVKVAVTSALIGAVPILFADTTNQITLMASIADIFKINIKKDGLKTLVVAALGVGSLAMFGRTIFSNLLNLAPGIAMAAVGCCNAPIARSITYGMGMAFIEVCKAVKVGKLQEADITSKKGKAMFMEHFTSYSKEKSKEIS